MPLAGGGSDLPKLKMTAPQVSVPSSAAQECRKLWHACAQAKRSGARLWPAQAKKPAGSQEMTEISWGGGEGRRYLVALPV